MKKSCLTKIKVCASYAKTVQSNKLFDEDNNSNKDINYNKTLFHENIPKLGPEFYKNLAKYSIKDSKNYIYDIEMFLNYPNSKILLFMWNWGETKLAKIVRTLTITKIAWNIKFFISPDLFNIIFPNNNIDSENSDDVKISKENPKILTNNQLFPKDIFTDRKNSIRIRFMSNLAFDFNSLLYNFILDNNKNLNKDYFKKHGNKKRKLKKVLEVIDPNINIGDMKNYFKKIIIHYHGGAFIAMSSSNHQTYLRKISNNLKIPIFSIDYRLAPVAKHPNLLYDCILGYFWVIQFLKNVIGVEKPEIILLGDSAGGNLVISVYLWLLENNLDLPTSLHINYPCLNLRYNSYTPSMLLAFNDLVLNFNGMRIALEYYIENKDTCETDSYLSPLIMKDKYYKMLPKIFLCCGTEDPVIDDCFRFFHNCIVNGKDDISFDCFNYLPHGLCGMDFWLSGIVFHKTVEKNLNSVINN